MPRVASQDTVRVKGLDDLRRELKKLDDDSITEDLKDAHFRVASLVVDRARSRARAMGGMEAKAAETLTARRGQRRAEVSFGGPRAPFAAGAEFGAYRDRIRLLKNRTGKGTGRAYIVRRESEREVQNAIRRIEAQKNINTGERVKVVGRVRGWNQFRPWRGSKTGAGYFLFPTIRDSSEDIVDTYGDELDRITRRAFPD